MQFILRWNDNICRRVSTLSDSLLFRLCSIVQHERYGGLTLVNSTGADTGEYTCFPMYCEDTDCRKEYDKAVKVFVFFPGTINKLFIDAYTCTSQNCGPPLYIPASLIGSRFTFTCYLIVNMPYLPTVPIRPTRTICSIVWLLRGDSAENQLADGAPLPGDVAWG